MAADGGESGKGCGGGGAGRSRISVVRAAIQFLGGKGSATRGIMNPSPKPSHWCDRARLAGGRTMIETELKIALDEAGPGAAAPAPGARAAAAGAAADARRWSRSTTTRPDHALAAAGVSLRLRRVGRALGADGQARAPAAWRRAASSPTSESERPAPGRPAGPRRPRPRRRPRRRRATAAGDAPLAPVFETRVRRAIERLRRRAAARSSWRSTRARSVAGDGTRADPRGRDRAQVSGEVGAVFAVARALFPAGPVRFAAENKAARGYRLARDRRRRTPRPSPRKARHARDRRARRRSRRSARDVLRDCLGADRRQHGGRRRQRRDRGAAPAPRRAAAAAHRASRCSARASARAAMAPLGDAARGLGQVVGRLRDADVLIDEVVAGAVGAGLDPAAPRALAAALGGAPRAGPRARCARRSPAREATGFLFDLGAFIEGRGWLVPSDYGQTARLAAPIAEVAPAMLDKRHRKVMKRGQHDPRARRRGPARAAQGAEEAALRRRHARAALPGRAGRALPAGAQGAAGRLRQPERRGDGRATSSPAPTRPPADDPDAQRGRRLGARHARGARGSTTARGSSTAGTGWRRRSPSG